MYMIFKLFLYLLGGILDGLDELGVVLGFAYRVGRGDDDNGFLSFFVENVSVFNVIAVVGTEVVERL